MQFRVRCLRLPEPGGDTGTMGATPEEARAGRGLKKEKKEIKYKKNDFKTKRFSGLKEDFAGSTDFLPYSRA